MEYETAEVTVATGIGVEAQGFRLQKTPNTGINKYRKQGPVTPSRPKTADEDHKKQSNKADIPLRTCKMSYEDPLNGEPQ